MAKKQNELYDQHTPIRWTELQDAEVRKLAEEFGVTVDTIKRVAREDLELLKRLEDLELLKRLAPNDKKGT